MLFNVAFDVYTVELTVEIYLVLLNPKNFYFRFVSRGFQMALWKTKPDIVVFLGDLLNDGSIVNDSDFNTTLGHFKTLLSVPNYVKVIIWTLI